MEHRTKRIIAHTAKNCLGLLLFVLAIVAFGAYIFVLQSFFGLSDEGAFVLTIFPAMLIGGIWLCYLKAREDVASLEHKEAMTMERLKQEYK